ncbi:cryptochrome/photolyase family protein [Thalassotalea ganghwensis]
MLLKGIKRLRLILGDQLNVNHSWFESKDSDTLYLIAELHQEASYTQHHAQKICAFFKAMEQFAQALQLAGFNVLHLTLDDTAQYSDLPALLADIIKQHRIESFEYQLPDEYRLRAQLSEFSQTLTIDTVAVESEHFYLADSELKDYFKQATGHRLEHFYRKLRTRFDVLMLNGQPEGGRWNYDKENRQKLKSADLAKVPEPLLFANDVSDIWQRIQRHKIVTIGKAEPTLLWPVTRVQAHDLLQFFCKYCLAQFGKFQDAMTGALHYLGKDQGWSLYHSRLSFALNSKILSPQYVVNTAIAYYRQSSGDITLAQIEGFVRQILGWREFTRGIYWANMPNYATLNHLNATRQLPDWFWSGDTKMRCLQHAISQSLEFAYAHHIQRLMVTGNFCLIAGIHPDEVDQWYLGIYIDAIEWVEMPNTRGMSQFADGGIVGSKAYAASGNYIQKMSDYCGDCHYQVKASHGKNACPLNALYWHFMVSHQAEFSSNPRNSMVYANWNKKAENEQQRIIETASYWLNHLSSL